MLQLSQGTLQSSGCDFHLWELLCFLVWQETPGTSSTFSAPDLETVISTRSPRSVQWETVLRNHKSCTRMGPQWFWVGRDSQALQVTQRGNLFSQDERTDEFTQTLSFKFTTPGFLLSLVNFISGFSSSRALHRSSQGCQCITHLLSPTTDNSRKMVSSLPLMTDQRSPRGAHKHMTVL